MERYKKVFALTPMLYTEGSPVIIEAGALQKDSVNGNIVAQLKFKSISPKDIKALTIEIIPLDVSGKPIGNKIEHQYLDLSVRRNMSFASNEAILLPDNTTRAFKVFVTKVVFDKTDMTLEESEWLKLPEQSLIDLDYKEKQYFIDKYSCSVKNPKKTLKYQDLWLCSCGTINHNYEQKCCHCQNAYSVMSTINYENLKFEALYTDACDLLSQNSVSSIESAIKEFNQILDYKDVKTKLAEAEIALNEAKQRLYEAEKKRKKTIALTVIVMCVCIAFGFALKFTIIPNAKLNLKYHTAVKLTDTGEYKEAYKDFCELGGYKDSDDKAEHIFNKYIKENLAVGDKIYFGKYEQDNDTSNGKENIEWRVLAKESNRILLITDKVIDYKEAKGNYIDNYRNLDNWLNDSFFNTSFTSKEQANIQSVNLSDVGLTSKIFLLNCNEAEKYFESADQRKCMPTAYVKANDHYDGYVEEKDSNTYDADTDIENGCKYYLRGVAYNKVSKPVLNWIPNVGKDGYVSTTVLFSEDEYYDSFSYLGDQLASYNGMHMGVRPAMWINIE